MAAIKVSEVYTEFSIKPDKRAIARSQKKIDKSLRKTRNGAKTEGKKAGDELAKGLGAGLDKTLSDAERANMGLENSYRSLFSFIRRGAQKTQKSLSDMTKEKYRGAGGAGGIAKKGAIGGGGLVGGLFALGAMDANNLEEAALGISRTGRQAESLGISVSDLDRLTTLASLKGRGDEESMVDALQELQIKRAEARRGDNDEAQGYLDRIGITGEDTAMEALRKITMVAEETIEQRGERGIEGVRAVLDMLLGGTAVDMENLNLFTTGLDQQMAEASQFQGRYNLNDDDVLKAEQLRGEATRLEREKQIKAIRRGDVSVFSTQRQMQSDISSKLSELVNQLSPILVAVSDFLTSDVGKMGIDGLVKVLLEVVGAITALANGINSLPFIGGDKSEAQEGWKTKEEFDAFLDTLPE